MANILNNGKLEDSYLSSTIKVEKGRTRGRLLSLSNKNRTMDGNFETQRSRLRFQRELSFFPVPEKLIISSEIKNSRRSVQ